MKSTCKVLSALLLLAAGLGVMAQELEPLLMDPTPGSGNTFQVVNWAPWLAKSLASRGGEVQPHVIAGRQAFRVKRSKGSQWRTLFFKLTAEPMAVYSSKTKRTVKQVHGRLVVYSPEVGTPLLLLKSEELPSAKADALQPWLNQHRAELLTEVLAYLDTPARDQIQELIKIFPAAGSSKQGWPKERAPGQTQSMYVRPNPVLGVKHIQALEPMDTGSGLLITFTPEGLKRFKAYREQNPKHFYLIRLGQSSMVAGRFHTPLYKDRLMAMGLREEWDEVALQTYLLFR